MRVLGVAVLSVAAFGLAVFAVGCGPDAGASAKVEPTKADTDKTTTPSKSTTADPPKGAGDAAKAAEDEVNKKLAPVQKAHDALKEKVTTTKKEAGTDAAKLTDANKLEEKQDKAGRMLKEVTDKVAGFKSQKDAAGVEAEKKSALETLDKVEKELAEFIPK